MSDETPKEAAAEGAPAKKGPKGVVLIGVLVGGLAAGAAGGLFAVGPMVAKSSGYVVGKLPSHSADGEVAEGEEGGDEASAEEGGGEEAAAEGEKGGGEHGGGKEGEGGGAAANLHLIDNLVLNPANSGGTRFLMVAAAIEFKDAANVEAFKARDAEVRDIVLRVMGAKTVEQLSDMSLRDSIRKELGDSLLSLLPKNKRKKAIRRVFFPQFVIQ